jgi:excisionase family DNA binding protein
MSTNLLGFAEASRFLGVSIFTLRRLADRGAIKTVNIGARRLVTAAELERVSQQGAGAPRRRKAAGKRP